MQSRLLQTQELEAFVQQGAQPAVSSPFPLPIERSAFSAPSQHLWFWPWLAGPGTVQGPGTLPGREGWRTLRLRCAAPWVWQSQDL